MDLIRRIIQTEPAVLVGVFVAACSLIGFQVSDEDVSALTQILTVVLPLVGSVVVRQAVTPAGKADAAAEQAALNAYRDIEVGG